jgi:ABC-type lipoprotein export system ATPase subunit
LEHFNLQVKRGEFLAVVGPSGCGKTTLLNLMGALDKPTAGKIFLEEQDISGLPETNLYKIRREKVGFIFQAFYLIPTLNVLQNVLIPTLPLKAKNKYYSDRAKELLKIVGLDGKEKRRPGELSGGEQQRVAIARALILDPVLILADEPTGNLDPKTGQKIFTLLRELNLTGKKTIITATHNQKIKELCDRVISLKDHPMNS